MKTLALLLAFFAGSIQNQGPMDSSALSAPPPCVEPAGFTYIWTPTSGCSTSTPCATDIVAGNNATQTVSGDLPTYGATCGPNSTPCLTFNGTTDFLNITTPVPSGVTAFTLYAVINLSASQVNVIFGGAGSGITYRINNTTNQPDLEESGVQGINGTQTLSLSTWYTEIVTYDNGTTTTSFFDASGGALNSHGVSASPAFTFSGTMPKLASDNFSELFNGKIAEWGYLNSVNTAGIANWSSCHYGV
jgi:hypothetical protein